MAPKALIDVLLGGGSLRVLPGDLCLVRFKDSALPQTDFERVALWPITNTEWMVLSPTGHVVSEELSGYERVIKITGQGYYPADVDKVTAFELPLDFVELQQWITTGRKEARLARSLRGLTLVGPEPVAAVDGWSGDPVALPAESVVGRITQRLSRKQAPPATGGVPVIVPLAGQEDLPPLGAPKEPPPDLLAEPAAPILPEAASPGDAAGGGPAIQPDPRKLFSKEVLTPKEGCTWVCIDALRSDKYSFGVAVDLAPGSVVRDDAGLFKVSDRDYVPVRQFDVGQTPFLQKRALNNLGWLGVEEEDGEAPKVAGQVAEQANIIRDLRERLAGSKPPAPGGGAGAASAGASPAKEPDDIRTLSVDYDDHGERFKRWRDLAREVSSVKFPDWPFDDSNSQALHLIKHWDRHAEDGLSWLSKWLTDRGVSTTERTGIEMKCLISCLQLAGTYDHLNIPVLACLETIARRIAQIVEAYSVDAKQPRWQGVHLYQGTTDAMAAIDPNLKANVVRKRKEELEVANLSNKVYGSTFTNVGDSLAAPAVDDGAAEAGKQAFNKKKKKKKPLTAPPGDKA